jgi:parallel beta-helix repeat protein
MGLVLMFVTAFVVIVVPVAQAASPPVIYVSPQGSDSTGTGSAGSPYATISHALSGATAGATVIVGPGTYTGELIVVTTQVTLRSQSSQAYDTIIDATGMPNGIAVVGSAAAGTRIEGFTVENANNHGIYVQDSSGVVIENNVVSNNGANVIKGLGEDKAIQLTGTSNSSVAGNTVVTNFYGGIGVADDGPIAPSWNNTAVPNAGIPAQQALPADGNLISGNFIYANRPNHCAIVVSAYDQGEGVKYNIMSDNVVVDNQNGIIVAADTPNTDASFNSVINNNVLNNGEGGVIVHSNAPGDVVVGNLISGNVFTANGYLPTLEGVILGGEGPVAVQNTTVVDNVFENEVIGIQVVNAKVTLVGGNMMETTVKVPVNGTVINISQPATSSGSQTTTVSVTATATPTAPAATTVVETAPAQTGSSASEGLTLSLALITAVGTLIVGLIIGIVVRPLVIERQHDRE